MPRAAGPPHDPRVLAQIAALHDGQVADVLRLCHAAEASADAPAAPFAPFAEPEHNRFWLSEWVALRIALLGDAAYAHFVACIAQVTTPTYPDEEKPDAYADHHQRSHAADASPVGDASAAHPDHPQPPPAPATS
ncbi:MAG: hypothetical protein EI684_04550 [Candidatus Viridilinea halotolerans]|uniref:Uncharacterized protein n=1 Tax=Candidatus Viridilinea halotolerans TaxID=2491704 RepID=A0A426U638_9CHLR|nr:MAG: hypothetical protein EI684_04550 [Candidatus Viridilinea halotolerans]